MALTTAHVDG